MIYTIVLNNSGTGTQQDNPGNELTDVLPAGPDAGLGHRHLRRRRGHGGNQHRDLERLDPRRRLGDDHHQATINPGTAPGTTISNQGAFNYDADGNGTNEASGVTDSPAAGGAADPTTFQVQGGSAPPPIPTLDEVGLMLLALLLAMGGAVMLRRRAAR